VDIEEVRYRDGDKTGVLPANHSCVATTTATVLRDAQDDNIYRLQICTVISSEDDHLPSRDVRCYHHTKLRWSIWEGLDGEERRSNGEKESRERESSLDLSHITEGTMVAFHGAGRGRRNKVTADRLLIMKRLSPWLGVIIFSLRA